MLDLYTSWSLLNAGIGAIEDYLYSKGYHVDKIKKQHPELYKRASSDPKAKEELGELQRLQINSSSDEEYESDEEVTSSPLAENGMMQSHIQFRPDSTPKFLDDLCDRFQVYINSDPAKTEERIDECGEFIVQNILEPLQLRKNAAAKATAERLSNSATRAGSLRLKAAKEQEAALQDRIDKALTWEYAPTETDKKSFDLRGFKLLNGMVRWFVATTQTKDDQVKNLVSKIAAAAKIDVTQENADIKIQTLEALCNNFKSTLDKAAKHATIQKHLNSLFEEPKEG